MHSALSFPKQAGRQVGRQTTTRRITGVRLRLVTKETERGRETGGCNNMQIVSSMRFGL